MDFHLLFLTIQLPIILSSSTIGEKSNGCLLKQYVEYNERGVLFCTFPEDYIAVYWHDIIDDREAEPILTKDGDGKRGEGFKSGEFDVFPNGSLIITNVSLAHEKTFTVVCLLPDEFFEQYHIDVVVTVTPVKNVPQISRCDDTNELCLIEYQQYLNLTCSVGGARPASEVSWSVVVGGREIPLNTSVTINTKTSMTFNSNAILDVASVSQSRLTHYVCSSKLQQESSWISRNVLVANVHRDFTTGLNLSKIYSERGRRAELSCALTDDVNMYVWKNTETNQIVSYAVKKPDGTLLAKEMPERYEIKLDGNLCIDKSNIEDEGKFICISSDGTTDNITLTNLFILVPPTPQYIVINECAGRECIRPFPETVALTCSVSGVRPSVDLQWTIEEGSNIEIKIQSHTTTILNGLHNVSSTIYLQETSTSTCRDTVILTCEARGAATYLFLPSTVVQLKVNCTTPESKGIHYEEMSSAKGSLQIYLMVIFSCLMAVTVILYVVFKLIQVVPRQICSWHLCDRWRSKQQLRYSETEQNLPPISSSSI